MIARAKPKMEQNYQCKFCGSKFHREKTLAAHMCVKKKRHLEIDSTGSRMGFRAFQKFYELSTSSKKPKTVEEFINSPYYSQFAKFGNHLSNLKPLYIEQFIEFVIKNGIDLKHWTNDDVYFIYITDLVKKEPAASAAERTITEIVDWAEKNNKAFNTFFSTVTANEAAYMIQTGRISPWVLYLCETGNDLINRFNDDHSKMIKDIIDPGYWMKKFKKSEEDVEYIRNVLEQAGL